MSRPESYGITRAQAPPFLQALRARTLDRLPLRREDVPQGDRPLAVDVTRLLVRRPADAAGVAIERTLVVGRLKRPVRPFDGAEQRPLRARACDGSALRQERRPQLRAVVCRVVVTGRRAGVLIPEIQ